MSTEKEVTITVSGMPKGLLKKINSLARREHRNRSAQVVKMLSDIVTERNDADRQPTAKAA